MLRFAWSAFFAALRARDFRNAAIVLFVWIPQALTLEVLH